MNNDKQQQNSRLYIVIHSNILYHTLLAAKQESTVPIISSHCKLKVQFKNLYYAVSNCTSVLSVQLEEVFQSLTPAKDSLVICLFISMQTHSYDTYTLIYFMFLHYCSPGTNLLTLTVTVTRSNLFAFSSIQKVSHILYLI